MHGQEDTCCNVLKESQQSFSLTSLHKANEGCKGHKLSLEFSLMLSASTVFSCAQPSATDGQSTQIHQLYECWESLSSHLFYGRRLFI